MERPCGFTGPQTAAAPIASEEERREAVAVSKAAADREYLAMRTALTKQAKTKHGTEMATREAEETASKARQRAVDGARVAWTAEHGSDLHRRAAAAGCRCQHLSVTERAAKELAPHCEIHRDGHTTWNAPSCPTPVALTEAERLNRLELGARVVWLTAPPSSIPRRTPMRMSTTTGITRTARCCLNRVRSWW